MDSYNGLIDFFEKKYGITSIEFKHEYLHSKPFRTQHNEFILWYQLLTRMEALK